MTAAERGRRPSKELLQTADRLYLAVIHLFRRLRREDEALGLGAAQLSALTTLIKGGPQTLGELAEAEGVKPPTITRLVRRLEQDGLVVRRPSTTDRRVVRVAHSSSALGVLEKGRAARAEALASRIRALSSGEREILVGTIELLETLAQEPESPAPTPR